MRVGRVLRLLRNATVNPISDDQRLSELAEIAALTRERVGPSALAR